MISHRQLGKIFYKPYPNLIWKYPSNQETVYLTFDDGPYPPLTKPLLSMLRELDVPATFFLSGERVYRHRRELFDLDYTNFILGNHLFHHLPIFGMSSRKLQKEIVYTDQVIYRYLKQLPRFLRPPYGVFGPNLFSAMPATSKTLVLWTVMAYDFKWPKQRILNYLHRQVRAGDIVVFHDSPQTGNVLLDIIPAFVDHVRHRGWKMGKIE